MIRRLVQTLSLFGSLGTLLCCALPALLVSIGMGATVAGLVSAVPQLVWLSERKGPLFLGSGLMLALAGWLQWRARNEPCPIDPVVAANCAQTRRWSLAVYWVSLGIYGVGVFMAYVAPRLFA